MGKPKKTIMTTLARITIALILSIPTSCGFDINFGDFGSGKKGNGNVTSETREITGSLQSFLPLKAWMSMLHKGMSSK